MIQVNCKRIARINSCGVRAWRRFFDQMRDKGVIIRFEECSTALMELNEIFHFVHKEEIISVYLPFYCGSCRKHWQSLHYPKHGDISLSRTAVSCPSCRSSLTFDDNPRGYFLQEKARPHAA